VSQGRILVVEDDLDISQMLCLYFNSQGYEVLAVARGNDALEICHNKQPNAVILDIMLPDLDGFDVCRKLRGNLRTSHIPIIFLTQKDARSEKIAGLELGADDYITKPFDIEELNLRVQAVIRRAEAISLTHPTTALPSTKLIDEQLEHLIISDDWALLHIVINHIDAFISTQDIIAQDDFLRFIAVNLNKTVEACGTPDDFIGHTSGNEFIIITVPAAAEAIKAEFSRRFNQRVTTFYDFTTRERGYAVYNDHEGNQQQAPLMRLSIGVLTAADGLFTDIRTLAAEARHRTAGVSQWYQAPSLSDSVADSPSSESIHSSLTQTTADISPTETVSKGRILVVEDDLHAIILLRNYFEMEGYEVLTAMHGEEALRVCRSNLPNVVLLDIMLLGMDGYDVCRELRADLRTSHIPIIFLTHKDEHSNMVAGLELGADYYITKPYDFEELKLRVQNVIRRAQRGSLTDAITGLPSAKFIEEQLKQLITRDDWAVLYISIHNLDTFVKTQDAGARDNLLRFVARNLNETVEAHGTLNDFIGHTSSDDFLVITVHSTIEPIRTEFRRRFDHNLPTVYDPITLERGYTIYTQHNGTKCEAPLISLSMGVLTSADGPFSDVREIAKAILELRHSHRDALVGEIETLIVKRNQLRDRVYALAYTSEVVERIESFGKWATGIIHDMRNGLEIIGLHVIRLSGCDEESLARIQRANRYAKILLETLSEIRFIGACKPDLMRLDRTIDDAISLVEPKIACLIETAGISEPITCYADPFQVEMALVNLPKFIGESMGPSQTKIELQLCPNQDWIEVTVDSSPALKRSNPEGVQSGHVESGPRLMESHLGAFEPRLYVAEKVVRRHNGYLEITAEGKYVEYSRLALPKAQAPKREIVPIRFLENEIRDLERELADLQEKLDVLCDKTEAPKEGSPEVPARLFQTVAGELFNELSIIQTTADTLLGANGQESILNDRLFKISRSCKFCRLLVRNLMSIGEDFEPTLTPIQIKPLIDGTLEMLEKYFPPQGVELKRDLAEDLHMVWATELGVQQILMNLILNALHAVARTQSPCLGLRAQNAEQWVEIAITDNGCGIPPEKLEKIFELGFTTRPGKEGGVGLSVVKRIVDRLHGEIEVGSKVDQGTTFTVRLPTVAQGG
jgi:DNA-binding response OmpR family regulator/signal transduction histidine kinase